MLTIAPSWRASRHLHRPRARAGRRVHAVWPHGQRAAGAHYQDGRWFDIWQFQRGLTSSLFLLLGGFAFSIATGRHWASHLRWSPALLKRVRRFGLFVVLGYALHLPGSSSRICRPPTPSAGARFSRSMCCS